MTKRIPVAIALFFCLLVAAHAADSLQADAAPSPQLGRSMPFQIYLPDGYAGSAQTYPVLYLLHGASGSELDWTRKGGAMETLQALIRRGAMRPTVVVMPSAGSDSWWMDGAVDKAESAVMQDLLPYVERRYRVGTARADRAVAGLSMGGFGALHFALKYPDRFCAAGLLSPAIYTPLPPAISSAWRTPQLMRGGEFDRKQWDAVSYWSHLPAYAKAARKVPVWIATGDHDALGIALLSAQLHARLLEIQPGQAELRVTDGGHEWMVWRDGLSDALQYLDRQCRAAP
ncbi:MAG TPA: alpha/beta hydrolase-fold protein [Burkholderiaceae bacterium]